MNLTIEFEISLALSGNLSYFSNFTREVLNDLTLIFKIIQFYGTL